QVGNIVIFAAGTLGRLGKQTKQAIALEMPETIIDLLEAVHVRDHDGEAGVIALATRQFAVELHEQRSCVGQPREVIGGGGIFGLLVLQSILNSQRHLSADRQQDAQVIGGDRKS